MAQIKIYGLKSHLDQHAKALSDVIHDCVMEAFHYPAEKRFHRFIDLPPERFVFPADRGEQYTIIEFSIFAGRSSAAKKRLINLLFERLDNRLGIPPRSVEITIFETPRENWGIRGKPGDELMLNYKVSV